MRTNSKSLTATELLMMLSGYVLPYSISAAQIITQKMFVFLHTISSLQHQHTHCNRAAARTAWDFRYYI